MTLVKDFTGSEEGGGKQIGLFGTKKRESTLKKKKKYFRAPIGVPQTATLNDPSRALITNQGYEYTRIYI